MKYQGESDKWNQESANFLVHFAELQKILESRLKDRQKIINKNSLYKTSFNQAVDYDYTKNSDFRAYAELLELAVDLDKSNPLTALKLAREYKNANQNKKAAFYFQQSIRFNENAKKDLKLTSQEFKKAIASLGNISYQEKRFVDAARYYEEVLKLEESPSFLFLLGSLHYERTGYYKRSVELLTAYLKQLNEKDESLLEVIEESGEGEKKKFFALHYIAQSYKKLFEYKMMLKFFEELRKLHVDFIQGVQNQKEKINEIFQELKKIKKTILNQTDRENLNQFYLIEKSVQKK